MAGFPVTLHGRIWVTTEAPISVIDAAIEHLRTIFLMLKKYPVLLDPKRLDRFLLTDKLHEVEKS